VTPREEAEVRADQRRRLLAAFTGDQSRPAARAVMSLALGGLLVAGAHLLELLR